jgi:arylsulfatase A-like enzyme
MKTPAPAILFLALATLAAGPAVARSADRPNIVVILADDVGYGDLGCYGATRVKTPHLDRLAAQGLRFTDAHAPSATCTPTRYALMTGEYAWRKKGTNVLPGDANLIVEPGRTTLPGMLKKALYTTAAIGKWHLGLGKGKIDWNGEIRPGPLEIGFDHCFLIPATGDRVPCVYVEDHRVAGLDPKDPIQVSYGKPVGDEPTGKSRPDLLKMKLSRGHDNTIVDGISRIGYMTGGKAARWKDEDMADTLTARAVRFIEKNRDRPFFLYFATHDVHVPRVPHRRFRGTSRCGVRGDAIGQLDASVGQVLSTLQKLKLADNTLVIFTSDNGPVVNDGYDDGADRELNGHRPAGPLRGGKYSLYEGGTRVPFLVRWPARIRKPGTSDALVCQVDLLASLAALVGQKLPAAAAPDSFDVLAVLLGKARRGREHLVEHAGALAIRQGTWKLIPAGTGPKKKKTVDELYDLATDLGETTNLAAKQPGKVKELRQLLRGIREKGHSRPGAGG